LSDRKKGRGAVLGDNPFGDLPRERPSRPPPRRVGGRDSSPVPPLRADLEGKISAVQEQVQSLILDVTQALESGDIADPGDRKRFREALVGFAGQMQNQLAVIQATEGAEQSAIETLLRLARPSFYLERVNRFFVAGRGVEVDRFGMDPVFERSLTPALEFMFARYWRIATEGLERVPGKGGCLLVANHAPVAGFDGLMLRWAVSRERGRPCRWLVEDELHYAPYIGMFCQKLGGVRASRENALRLLRQGVAVVTFPEGNRGIRRLYRDRYRLDRFGRGGFVRLAIRERVPVIPTAIVGPEESAALLMRIDLASSVLSLPFIPVTPTVPLLGPLGILPLPRRWTIRFGEPIVFDEGPEAAEDQAVVSRLGEEVRSRVQGMIDDMIPPSLGRGKE